MVVTRKRITNWRLIAFRVTVLFVLLVNISVVMAILLLPTKADAVANVRLLGKWGIYLPASNIALPPERIIEFLPGGQQADYSSELELLGRTVDNQSLESNWFVHRGVFISTLRNPPVIKEPMNFRSPIAWIDEDNFVLAVPALDGTQTPIRYRRISASEIERIKCRANE